MLNTHLKVQIAECMVLLCFKGITLVSTVDTPLQQVLLSSYLLSSAYQLQPLSVLIISACKVFFLEHVRSISKAKQSSRFNFFDQNSPIHER